MISLVLYGRNDSYGYNLHKRAALSLNCMAEVLSGDDDEIIFVDYNTPNDYPTFPEAIQDTLTPRAQNLLRVLRVRPWIHERFRQRTHLVALEPVARNIALRRSNPANRWILSTNTDMIFVPRQEASLTDLSRDLPEGFYCTPRFEIPESLWETFDRRDPKAVIEATRRWGWDAHLNEIVHSNANIRYDGPGDFQLMARQDLFAIHGFDEEMLLGWHVDSNISRRLKLVHGEVGDMVDRVFGYHCDHTRQATPAHKRSALANSIGRFVTELHEAKATHQAETWGCPNDDIEEIRLDRTAGHVYLDGLRLALGEALERPTESSYVHETFALVSYDPCHVLPYLTDLIVAAPRHWSLGWFGGHAEMAGRFAKMWHALGFTGKVLVPDHFAPLLEGIDGLRFAPEAEVIETADLFVFDHVGSDGRMKGSANRKLMKEVAEAFERVADAEIERLEHEGAAHRRMIGINAVHNAFEQPFAARVAITRTPFSARIRHGFITPALGVRALKGRDAGSTAPLRADWLPDMMVGDAGTRLDSGIQVRPDVRGTVLSGPPGTSLVPGTYRLDLELERQGLSLPEWRHLGWSLLNVEIYQSEYLILRRKLRLLSMLFSKHRVFFEIPASALNAGEAVPVEVRISTRGHARAIVRVLSIERCSARRLR